MNERTDLCHRMLSEAQQRVDEFSSFYSDNLQVGTTKIRRPLSLLITCDRNMDWITGSPAWFQIPHECIIRANKLRPVIKNLINSLSGQIVANRVHRLEGKESSNKSSHLIISSQGNGILTPAEIDQVDAFISVLENAPPVEYMALHESAREQRRSEIRSVLSDNLSFGEATNAPPILNQSEEQFRATLNATNNDIIGQIKIIEHFLPRWFSMGDFPPPYYAWRVAVLLRKAREHGREFKFLRTYLSNLRSCFVGSTRDEMLVERAKEMGIDLPPVR